MDEEEDLVPRPDPDTGALDVTNRAWAKVDRHVLDM